MGFFGGFFWWVFYWQPCLEAVLAADRARLKAMVQPPLVYAQLKELFSLVGDDSDGNNRDFKK